MSPSDVESRLAKRTLELVRIPSIYGDEGALADYFENWGNQVFGAQFVHRVGNALWLGNADERPSIVLVGHLDTVAPPEGAGWQAHVQIDGDRVVGLGSSDMKGGLAVAQAICEDLRENSPFNIFFALYDKEEGPHIDSGIVSLIDRFESSRTSLAIVMEPTDGLVQLGCVGSLHARVTFHGQAAHSARPWHGENAIHKAGSLLTALAARGRNTVKFDGLEFHEVMNATLADGGTGRTTIPAAFTMNINYRFAPGKSIETAEKEVLDLVGAAADVEFTDRAPSGRVCQDNEIVKKWVDSGVQTAPKQAWTDVARLTEVGIDAVNFGPGETAQAHQRGESASVPALAAAYESLRALLG